MINHLRSCRNGGVGINEIEIFRLLVVVDQDFYSTCSFNPRSDYISRSVRRIEIEDENHISILDSFCGEFSFIFRDDDLLCFRHPFQEFREIVGYDHICFETFLLQIVLQTERRTDCVAIGIVVRDDDNFVFGFQELVDV